MAHYRIVLSPDDNDTLLVTSPDFPELVTFADDDASAELRAYSAMLEAISARIAVGDDLPAPINRLQTGDRCVPLSLNVEAKVALYRCLRSVGINRARH